MWQVDSQRRPNWSDDPVWLPAFVRLSGLRVYFLMPNSADLSRDYINDNEGSQTTGWCIELGVLGSVSVLSSPEEVAWAEDPALRAMTNIVQFAKNMDARVDDGVSRGGTWLTISRHSVGTVWRHP